MHGFTANKNKSVQSLILVIMVEEIYTILPFEHIECSDRLLIVTHDRHSRFRFFPTPTCLASTAAIRAVPDVAYMNFTVFAFGKSEISEKTIIYFHYTLS